MPSAQPAFFCPNLSISVSAIFCAPPLASRIPPNIEPKPTSSAIPCSVFPTPFSTVSEIIDSGIPAPTPIITAESIIEIIGWSLKRIIKISSMAIPTTAAAINLTGSAAKTISSILFLLSIHQMLFLAAIHLTFYRHFMACCPFYSVFVLNSSDVFILHAFISKSNTVILLKLSNIFCAFFLFNNSY